MLALMARSLGGEFRSIGTDKAATGRLRDHLARLGLDGCTHLATVPLMDAEFDGIPVQFPAIDTSDPDAAFELIWVSTAWAMPGQRRLDHVLPTLSTCVSQRGFDVILEGVDTEAAEHAIRFWDALTDSALSMSADGLHGSGLLVSGRPEPTTPGPAQHSAPHLTDVRTRSTIRRPVLTLPEQEAREVARQYGAAETILEYGSGGSTVLAAELPGKMIFSVESDPKWLCRLGTYLQSMPHPSMPVMYYADIGATGDWGRPTGNEGRENYPDYSLGIWRQEFFRQPDLVLVDGRFRPACFLVCAALTSAPVTILFDDYANRPHYHYIEAVARPVRMVGRMAVFQLAPGDFREEHRPLLAKALYEPE